MRREERWSDEDTKAALEREESDWRERSVVWDEWARDWGSDVVREERGRVERRERYLRVILSLRLGRGRGDVLSK